MPTPAQKQTSLYNRDFYLWTQQQIEVLRNKNYAAIDLVNLIEEIEDMGRSEKKAVGSNLRVVLLHLLKYKYQPSKRSDSWENSIIEHRIRLMEDFEASPSLKRHCEAVFQKQYQYARKQAAVETRLSLNTFPSESPFTLTEVLDIDFLPGE